MDTIITAIQKTPIPTILIAAGLLFLLLGFVTKLGGIIEVSTDQKRLTIPIGLLVLAIGLVLNFLPATTAKPPDRNLEALQQPQKSEQLKAEEEFQKLKREAQALRDENAEILQESKRARTETAPPKPVAIIEPKIDDAPSHREPEQREPPPRPKWRSHDFPSPNGGLLVFTITPDGDPACASYDGANCLWGNAYDQIDFGKLAPLACGEGHLAKWGTTGYEDPKHWCNLAKSL